MINSLSALKQISKEQGIDSATTEAIETVSQLLDEGLSKVEMALFESTTGALNPVGDIADYILDAGGKRIRPALCMLSAKMFDSAAEPVVLSAACELLHNATLLHDDVIDEGDIRRGKPASRMVWSNALSILGGDYMLMRCVEMISQMDAVYMARFVETLKALVEGEIIQLRLRESVETTKEDYFDIVRGKTSSLFCFATSAGALAGNASGENVRHLGEFGSQIGASFQLIDDVLDFSEDADVLGKNLLADISQGKMTLPVILAAEKNVDVKKVLLRLKGGDAPEACAAEISHAVQQSGSLEKTREEAVHRTNKSIEALDRVDAPIEAVVTVLKQLSLMLLERGN